MEKKMKKDFCDVKTAKLSYRLYGDLSNPLILVETAMGACNAEWWHLAEKWSSEYCVLLYDRAGYGSSSSSSLPRNPVNIATELNELLTYLEVQKQAILIGHSIGGLFAQQFARMFPDKTQAVILLDPVSPNNHVLKQKLSKQEYFQCGFDKSMNMKLGLVISSFGLGFLLKSLLKKGPPFYYYQHFSKEAEDAILQNFTQRKTYQSSLAEYKFIEKDEEASNLIGNNTFPDIPLFLICHTHEVMTAEIVEYGGAEKEIAAKCDDIWLSLMKEYLELSSKSTYMQAKNSGHFIHLTDPDTLWDTITSIGG
jgi:pimeloyl-ACP methyl ester carboxylesterase